MFFIQRAEVDEQAIARVAARLLGAAVDGRYDIGVDALGDDTDAVRAIVGHLARAGVLRPAPGPLDRLRGRVLGPYDGRAAAACRTSAGEAQRARWRQYRAVWAFVEGDECRRAAILRHFGDPAPPRADGPCCDVCDPELVPAAPQHARRAAGAGAPGDLDAAIVDVVTTADPAVGRTRTVEILRGGRSQVVRKNAYDGLPAYGTFAHLRADEVLERVDELLEAGRLASTGGAYPKLRLGQAA
ncbi:MAG: RecQ family zinc-binding domain-containing protein [Solirubrobacteraceae bacterium]